MPIVVRTSICLMSVSLIAWLGASAAFAQGGWMGGLRAQWVWDPLVVVTTCAAGLLYARGLHLLWRSSRPGRGIRRWEAVCYAGGWLVLVLALVSPLHSWGEMLFSAHMTQHELLMLVAAPLIVLGRPLLPFLWALPVEWARVLGSWTRRRGWLRVWRAIVHPLVAWSIHFVALWMWHIPALFSTAVENDLVHGLQHASFFGSALLFWWAVVHGGAGRLGYGMAVLYIFTTGMHNGVLGLLLTYSTDVWYPVYGLTAPLWGFSPLEDQQLGGLIMWIPAAIVYLVAGCVVLAAWLRESEDRIRRREAGATTGG